MFKVTLVEPADLVEGRPELASLIDIDLASLLSIRLSKLLTDPKSIETGFEDPPLATKVCSAAQAKCAREVDLCLVEHISIWVVRKVEDVAAGPVCFEDLWIATWQC